LHGGCASYILGPSGIVPDERLGENRYPWAWGVRLGLVGKATRGSGKLFALKALSKGHIVQERLKGAVQNEKICLDLLSSEFVVKLVQTYRDDTCIYFLLEPCFCGELFDLYAEHDELFGSEAHAQFYAACVAEGLEHMHSRCVIYRDLKLENCLLTDTGYLKLTDLGIGKVCIGKTYTVCGTTDYFAPETLRQTGHNRAVDWWALGVMMYILMTGRSPFDAPDAMKVYRKIIKGFAKVSFPDGFPEKCLSMILALCQKVPEERLTMGNLGFQNYKDHPWYRGFVWKQLESLQMPAPYIPTFSQDAMIEKVRTKQADDLPQIPYEDDGSGWDDLFAL